MRHNISAIILKGHYDEAKAKEYDLLGIDLGFDLALFRVNHYYSACWQALLKTSGMLDINGVITSFTLGRWQCTS